MSSGSEYEPTKTASAIDTDSEDSPSLQNQATRKRSAQASRQSSDELDSSPRKRRRRSRSRSRVDRLNNSYRTLYDEMIDGAVERLECSNDGLRDSQIGVSTWSAAEKVKLFAALERLGRDDLPGIAEAVNTKSIPEIMEYLTLLQDTAVQRGRSGVTLYDIPPAAEISPECCQKLELLSDAFAHTQEMVETEEEKELYGKYWLITPEVAEEVHVAISRRRRRRSSSPASTPQPIGSDSDSKYADEGDQANLDIVDSIPSSRLLLLRNFLNLSMRLFMNASPTLPSGSLNWTQFVTPLVDAPSMYHSALDGFHTLVLSLTRRLVQASLVQATSRIRSHDWREIRGVDPLVRKGDVLAAVDMLRLPRSRAGSFKRVARRCGVRVFDGKGRNARDITWDEAERLLTMPAKSWSSDSEGTNVDTDGESAWSEGFVPRASRAATPLPSARGEPSEDESVHDASADSAEEQRLSTSRRTSLAGGHTSEPDSESESSDDIPSSTSGRHITFDEAPSVLEVEQQLETLDQKIGRDEEARLCSLLRFTPPREQESPELERTRRNVSQIDQDSYREHYWRDRTEYRAEWETLSVPVPAESFLELQRKLDDSKERKSAALDSFLQDQRMRGAPAPEIPIRGTRSYATLHERLSESQSSSDNTRDDDADEEVEQVVASVEQDVDTDTDSVQDTSEESEPEGE